MFCVFLFPDNLYGWAMSKALPTHDFRWLSQEDIHKLDVTAVADDAQEGYILECDIIYPTHLHDRHNDYPLAPESQTIDSNLISPYARELASKIGQSHVGGTRKLVNNLQDKTRYVVHYQNLKLYMRLGLEVTKVHKVLAFKQSPWMQPYINFNTQKRAQSQNDFEKSFWKLMNNAVFGKTMENLRNRVNIQLVQDSKKFRKLVAKPNFRSFRIFNKDLTGVQLHKTSLTLNKPIYVGFSILETSKILMYEYHYDVIKAQYGDRARLLFTDTDSLCYHIETNDMYEDMSKDAHLYDFSDYPCNHPLFSIHNKKVLGKMKDETKSIPIKEFVGLRSKMYSILVGNEEEKKTAKGITAAAKKNFKHESYLQCLQDEVVLMASMHQIRSFKHELYTIRMTKIGLSPYDDKRFLCDSINSLAYGHYHIPKNLEI